MTFEEFKALFTVHGLSVESRLWQSSLIVISEKGRWPSLDLFVFHDYNGMMKRSGIESMVDANQLQTISHFSFKFGETTAAQSEVWVFQYLDS